MLDYANVKAIEGLGLNRTTVGKMTIHALRQPLTGLMEKSRGVLGGACHLKFTYVEGVDLRQIGTAAFFDELKDRFAFFLRGILAREQTVKSCVGGMAVHFWQQVHQIAGLRAIVRRISVDLQKRRQAADQVVKGGCEIGVAVKVSPAVEKKAIAFIFFQRRGVEDTQHMVADTNRFHSIPAFAGCAPVKSVHIL